MQNIYLVTLGCEKNTVDGEHILSILENKGFNITLTPENADVIIINTCAFIEDAKKESIDAIFEHTIYKQYGRCKRIIVSGCMSERYKEDFLKMFKEVDAAIGIYDLEKILDALEKDGFYGSSETPEYKEYGRTVNTKNNFSSYIRISDGCHANCSFCAIPKIRGSHRSRKMEAIIEEAEYYAKNGTKEINLIAQETTFYGYDIYKELALPELLKNLSIIEGIEWIRVLYQNPVILNDNIIESFFTTKKVVPYFDIPLQHVDRQILKDMHRAYGYKYYKEMIEKIRSFDINAAIRTSFIVGFPGETKDEFKKLLKFIHITKIDRVGVFTYSEEENTDAALLRKQYASRQKKLLRRERLMQEAIEVSEERLSRFIGKTADVLIENFEDEKAIGRTMYDAPEVDGIVSVYEIDKKNFKKGDIVKVNITHNTEYDLIGNLAK